jgi:cell shape-determining protein MreD
MSWLPQSLLFVAAWLCIFAETLFPAWSRWIGGGVNLLPSLVAFAALHCPAGVAAGLALFGGIASDSLTSDKLGVSVGPLVLVGWIIHHRRRLILKEQFAAQLWVGLGAGLLAPAATLALITLGQRPAIAGWGDALPWLAGGLANAAASPGWRRLFDWLERILGEPKAASTSFRNDREIKRGRT